jgi:hypothetical protein
MQNKLFIGFVVLIIMAHIHKVMTDHDLYASMTLKKLLKTLEHFRVQYINGQKIVYPLTSEQKAIFDAFDISHPMKVKNQGEFRKDDNTNVFY